MESKLLDARMRVQETQMREEKLFLGLERTFIIEVQYKNERGECIPLGYIDWLFESEKKAAEFYERRHPNSHMSGPEYSTQWNHLTNLRCLVRPSSGICTDIKYFREVLPGIRKAIEYLNKYVREENNKNQHWPHIKLPEEEEQDLKTFHRRELLDRRLKEVQWALDVSLSKYNKDQLRVELDHCCGSSSTGQYQGSALVLEELLSRGAIPTMNNLLDAITRGYDDIVTVLLNDGRVDPRKEKRTLLEACRMGHTNIVRLLLGTCEWSREIRQEASSLGQYANARLSK